MKRFYENATSVFKDGVFSFFLDEKPIKTPLGSFLLTSYPRLADVIISEWNNQLDTINPKEMPFTKYLNSTIDTTGLQRSVIIDNLIEYAHFDALFHFTDETNEEFFKQQINEWLPVLQRFEKDFSIKLNFDTKLLVDKQPPELDKIVLEFLNAFSNEQLTSMYKIITILGSVILAMTAFNHHISYEKALSLSRLEQDYNCTKWGTDPEAERIQENINQEYALAIEFLKLCE